MPLMTDATMEDEARVPQRGLCPRRLLPRLGHYWIDSTDRGAPKPRKPRCGNTCDCTFFGEKCHLPGSGVEMYYPTTAEEFLAEIGPC